MGNLEQLTTSVINGVPPVIVAILFFILILIVSSLVRKIVVKLGDKCKLQERFMKLHVVSSEEKGTELIKTLGNLAYLIVFLIMIPSVFSILGMNNIAAPITSMATNLLDYVPSIIGASLVVFVGYLLSKIAKEVVTVIAKAVGVDKLACKLTGSNEADSKLAELLGSIVFAIIIIPTIITALDVLHLKAISEPLTNMLGYVFDAVPTILLSIIMVVIGVFIAKIIGNIFGAFMESAGVNKLAEKDYLKKYFTNVSPSVVLTKIVKFIIIALFVFEAVNILHLTVLQGIANTLVAYSPNVIAVILIVMVVFFFESFLSSLIMKASNSKGLALLSKIVIYTFTTFMVLSQLGIAQNIVSIAFIFVMGALSLTFILAFGLGGKDFAKSILEKLNKKIDK